MHLYSAVARLIENIKENTVLQLEVIKLARRIEKIEETKLVEQGTKIIENLLGYKVNVD